MRNRILLAVLLLTSPLTTFALTQEKRKAEEKRDGLVITYDKFRDRTFVRTERFDLLFESGGRTFVCSAFFAYLKDNSELGIVLAVTPGAGTAFGSFAESLDRDEKRRVYFSPDADVIILIGEQRYKLGRVTKDFGFTPSGTWKDSVFIEVPAEIVRALAQAEKWEMAIGSLETKVVSRYAKKLRKRLTSIEEEFKKDRAGTP